MYYLEALHNTTRSTFWNLNITWWVLTNQTQTYNYHPNFNVYLVLSLLSLRIRPYPGYIYMYGMGRECLELTNCKTLANFCNIPFYFLWSLWLLCWKSWSELHVAFKNVYRWTLITNYLWVSPLLIYCQYSWNVHVCITTYSMYIYFMYIVPVLYFNQFNFFFLDRGTPKTKAQAILKMACWICWVYIHTPELLCSGIAQTASSS